MIDFEKIFENVTVPLSVADPCRPNRLVFVNRAYCEMTGYSKDELIGRNPGELLQGGPYSKQRDSIRTKLNAYETVDVLIKNYRKDGAIFWNELHIHPVMENGVCVCWIGTPIDVTQRIVEVTSYLETFITAVKKTFTDMRGDLEQFGQGTET